MADLHTLSPAEAVVAVRDIFACCPHITGSVFTEPTGMSLSVLGYVGEGED